MNVTLWRGWKTYAVAAATVLYGAVEWSSGAMTQDQALQFIFAGSGLAALRHGVSGSIITIAEQVLPAVLNAVKEAKPAAKTIILLPLVGMALLLQACQLTGNISADTAAFASQVAAFDAKAQSDIAALNSGAITDAVAVGKSSCGFISMQNGLFNLVALPLIAAGSVAPSVGASEQAVMGGVNLACNAIDTADPAAPAAAVAAAVAAVLAAVPTVKANLQAASPSVAASATAPPAAAPTPTKAG
jgi:hypothetical protein